MRQTSRGKFNRPQRIAARSTTGALDGYGLRCRVPARPASYASYLVLLHRLAPLLHASFRPRLTTTPLRFAITSPPSGCEEDSHLQAVEQCWAHIGIGGGLTTSPLPHHRTCGSASGGSDGLSYEPVNNLGSPSASKWAMGSARLIAGLLAIRQQLWLLAAVVVANALGTPSWRSRA